MRGKTDPSLLAQKTIAFYLKCLSEERDAILRSDDIEHVHRMRVATRRLRAVLDVFSIVLPAGLARTSQKKISKIGKALGRARELDVQIRFLKTLTRDQGRDRLLIQLKNERAREQKKITRRLTDLNIKEKLPELILWLQRPVSEDGIRRIMSFRSHAKNTVRERTDKLLALSSYAGMPRRVKELHRLRIAAKKLRYTLELLKPWCGTRINDHIRASRAIQDILGDVHELDVLIKAIHKTPARHSALAATCADLRQKTYLRFVRLWKIDEKQEQWEKLGEMF
jgi:CHAD domain-containing protein